MKQAIFTFTFVAALCVAISQTESDGWLTLWFLLFFFVGIPLALLAVRDLLVAVKPKWLGRGPLLLHTCAVFAALIGYLVGWMAVDSEHPKAHLHELMVVVFPVMVYLTPLLMILHGLPISKVKYFYFGSDDDDT